MTWADMHRRKGTLLGVLACRIAHLIPRVVVSWEGAFFCTVPGVFFLGSYLERDALTGGQHSQLGMDPAVPERRDNNTK